MGKIALYVLYFYVGIIRFIIVSVWPSALSGGWLLSTACFLGVPSEVLRKFYPVVIDSAAAIGYTAVKFALHPCVRSDSRRFDK